MMDFGIDQQLTNGLAGWSVTYFDGVADDGIFSIYNPVSGKHSPQNVESPVDMSGVEAAFAPLGWWTGSWDSRIRMLGDDTL